MPEEEVKLQVDSQLLVVNWKWMGVGMEMRLGEHLVEEAGVM